MAVLNNNGFLAVTGVGLFGSIEGDDETDTSAVFTILHVAGWIPGVSLIAGIASLIFAYKILGEDDGDSAVVAAFICRGMLQIAQVGILLAPFDIGFSLVRLVREHMKYLQLSMQLSLLN
jgi:hypothetical protein